MTVCERIFRDLKFELPSTEVKRFVINRELVDNPPRAMDSILAEHRNEEHKVLRRLVHEFSERFREAHSLTLRFTDEAAERLVAER